MAKAKSYFWTKAAGVNADIERHREKEQELQARMDELEAKPVKTERDLIAIRTWQNFMCQLQASKAEAVDRLGRK